MILKDILAWKKTIKSNIGVIVQGYVDTALTSVFKLHYDLISYARDNFKIEDITNKFLRVIKNLS